MRTVLLGDIADIHDSQRIPLSSRERTVRKGDIPYYGAQGVIDHIDDYIFDGDYVLIAEDGENLRSRKQPVAFRAKGKFWVNNHAHIIRGKERWINDYIEAFLNYCNLSPYVTGAAQPKLNKKSLLSIKIPYSKEVSVEIANQWSAIQDKIELNRRMNETLEQMGQALFKHYFIDNLEAKNWEKNTAKNVLNFQRGIEPGSKSYYEQTFNNAISFYRVGDLTNKGSEVYIDKDTAGSCYTDEHEVLVSFDGAPGMVRAGYKGAYSSGIQKVTPNNKYIANGYVYFLMKSEYIQRTIDMYSTGTTIKHAGKSIDNMNISIPENMQQQIDILDNIFSKIILNIVENQNLSSLRDSLLPRLISGKIEV